MTTQIQIADLFCGAGGTSTGCILAARELGLDISLLAINHWQIAVETHRRNHPWARHLCADLGSVDPNRVVPAGCLRLLVASPECTHHSIARGGKPRNDQSRASAWHVLHWAERLRIENILIENVAEFQTWGPLGANGQPDKSRKGQTYRAFLNALESLGYQVQSRVLNAADYGDATTRRRLFIQARRGQAPIWPDPTHSGTWRAAREIIDWSCKGESIFRRKRQLSANTMRRIEAGLRKFGGEPFLTILNGTDKSQLPSTARSCGSPLPTQTTNGHIALCQPFIIQLCHSGGDRVRTLNDPLPTIPAGHRGECALVEPFIVGYHDDRKAKPRVHSINNPLPTQTTENRFALCEPFLTKYYGSAKSAQSVREPLDTVTTKERFALVQPQTDGYQMDILFRMLQPHELASAMGFDDYEFSGNKTEKVRQIGNAVPVHLAKALCKAILAA